MSAYEFLQVERQGKVARVTLNRPGKRNALSIAVRNEFDRCFEALEGDNAVSVVVLRSEGPVFCAGFDLKEFSMSGGEHQKALADSSHRYHRRLTEFRKPLVAGIQGAAMGGGFDLAVMADVRIATPEAAFGHPEIKFGAPVLYGLLRETIGGGLARDLCLSGRRIDAAEAHRIGLVSRIVESGQLTAVCHEVAEEIAEAPPGALKALKRQIVESFGGWKMSGEAVLFPTLPGQA
jgi:enoyl-CoA hydratase/carnithine racemase